MTETISYDVDARFVTVLRAPSAVRLPPGQSFAYNTEQVDGTWELTFRTKYIELAPDRLMPRAMWVEVVGPGTSLRNALGEAQGHANVGASVMGLAMNASTDSMLVEFCFHASREREDHEFRQVFHQEESGYPRHARVLDVDAVDLLFSALNSSPYAADLYRAISQYELALRAFLPGMEVIAFSHLWMAMETLTAPAVAREQVRRGSADRHALAEALSVEPLRCQSCNAVTRRAVPESAVRRDVLFDGDAALHKRASEASNGFEHGYGTFEDIRATAVAVRNPLARLVRRAIFDLAEVDQECRSALVTDELDDPLPSSRVSKFITATLVGDPASFAQPEKQYPYFELRTEVTDVRTDPNGNVTLAPKEDLTQFVGADVKVLDPTLEIWGPEGGIAVPVAASSAAVAAPEAANGPGEHVPDTVSITRVGAFARLRRALRSRLRGTPRTPESQ